MELPHSSVRVHPRVIYLLLDIGIKAYFTSKYGNLQYAFEISWCVLEILVRISETVIVDQFLVTLPDAPYHMPGAPLIGSSRALKC